MSRPAIGPRAMTSTERTRHHRTKHRALQTAAMAVLLNRIRGEQACRHRTPCSDRGLCPCRAALELELATYLEPAT